MNNEGSILDLPLRVVLAGWALRRITPFGTHSATLYSLDDIFENNDATIMSIYQDLQPPITFYQRLVMSVIRAYRVNEKRAYQQLVNLGIVNIGKVRCEDAE